MSRVATVRPARRSPQIPPWRALAIETAAKFVISLALFGAVVSTLGRLLTHYQLQQEKLTEIEYEVNQVETRVNQLQSDFQRYFDPTQTTAVMQEQTNRLAPNQQRIIFIDPPPSQQTADSTQPE